MTIDPARRVQALYVPVSDGVRLAVEPGQDLDVAVELLPIAVLLRAGHKIQVALGGHDAACFDRYGPPDETFTVQLGDLLHARSADPGMRPGSPSRQQACAQLVSPVFTHAGTGVSTGATSPPGRDYGSEHRSDPGARFGHDPMTTTDSNLWGHRSGHTYTSRRGPTGPPTWKPS